MTSEKDDIDDIVNKLKIAYRRLTNDDFDKTKFWEIINDTFNSTKSESSIKSDVNTIIMTLIDIIDNTFQYNKTYPIAMYTGIYGWENQPWLYADVLGEVTGNKTDGYTFSPKYSKYRTELTKNGNNVITNIQFIQTDYPDNTLY